MTRGRFRLFFVLAGGGFLLDVTTKAVVFARFFDPRSEPRRWWLIPDVLGIETTTNPGALFGMFAGMSGLFAAFSIVAIAGIVIWLWCSRATADGWLTACLGLIAGGILGNLFDRLGLGFRPGYPETVRYNVRDWILFRWEGVPFLDPWPNFNIADSLLVCGAAALMAHAFWVGRAEPTTRDCESGGAASGCLGDLVRDVDASGST